MKIRRKRPPEPVVTQRPAADLRHGDWREVLTGVEVDALITDPPFGERVHEFVVQRADETSAEGLRPGYGAWTRDHVFEFVRSWSPRTRGWMACLTSHDLIPAFEDAYRDVGRYHFAPIGVELPLEAVFDPLFMPIGCVVDGMSVRMLGDGPSSWTLHLMVARPRTKAMMHWGTLPGGYHGPASRESSGGRGKPPWLMQAIVRDYSRSGDLIGEPFCGYGSTFEACEALGRRCVGSEVNIAAHDEAQRRIQRPTQVDLFGGLGA